MSESSEEPTTINVNATVFVWTIDNFMSQDEYKLTSDSFTIPGYPVIKWQLGCNPNGVLPKQLVDKVKELDGFVTFFINKLTGDCEIKLDFQLELIGGDGLAKMKNSMASKVFDSRQDVGYGYPQFVSRNQLKDDADLLVNGALMLRAKINRVIRVVYYGNVLVEKLNLNNLKHCDVRLKTDGKTFEAHKFMLAKQSSYFNKRFYGELKEKGDKDEVDLTEFGSNVIEEMLRFIYINQLQDFDSISNQLIEIAIHFQLHHLESLCQDNMTFRISIDNCLDFVAIADKHDLFALKKAAMRFIYKNKMAFGYFELESLFSDHPALAVELFRWNDDEVF